jgi:hypothetical protein
MKTGSPLLSRKPFHRSELKKALSLICLLMSLGIIIVFAFALHSALKSHDSDKLSCQTPFQIVNGNYTYLDIVLLEQDPIQPYFNGKLFVNLVNAYGQNPMRVTFLTSGSREYDPSAVTGEFYYSESQNLLMNKAVDIALIRTFGSHRNFPLDSAQFDFDIAHVPALPIKNFNIRNRNQDFDIPCGSLAVDFSRAGKLHIRFEARRNSLVQLTAVVLLGAALVFLIRIVVFVKSESLPTAIASYFFSLWSIRSIFSSEMKTFPTYFDVAILSLCVLLLVGLGVRLSLKELRGVGRRVNS